jgi:hypothetical protein
MKLINIYINWLIFQKAIQIDFLSLINGNLLNLSILIFLIEYLQQNLFFN